MQFKPLTAVLALALIVESIYLLAHRHPTNRFKSVEQFGHGLVAFDTATGQVCTTVRTGPLIANQRPAGASNPSPRQPSGDAIADEIQAASKEQMEQDATLELLQQLPVCADIR
jgi:hypothetical protein